MNTNDLSITKSRLQNALFWQEKTGHPEKSLRLVAVTGTNGKTTVSTLLCNILRENGEKTGLIGTVECSDGEKSAPSDYTTPPPEILYPTLQSMVKNGVTTVIMEASSHALAQGRLHGLSFALAIFTNLSRDHLDYHKTEKAYLAAKASLFESAKISLLNGDDPLARAVAFHAAGDVYYYAQNENTEFSLKNVCCTPSGIAYTWKTAHETQNIKVPLIGSFNVYNTAAALSAATLLGIQAEKLPFFASQMKAPTGRLEKLSDTGDIAVFIDNAHTPDALEKALSSLKCVSKKLTVLFGAGGERDQGKRAMMGKVAEAYADLVIVTSDNPRGEAPDTILSDIVNGMEKDNHLVICDRKSAILYALSHAEKGETVLLAGKGHETYLHEKDGKHPFCEKKIVQEFFNTKGK